MKLILEGWRQFVNESQQGTAFEDVIIAVAHGDMTGGAKGKDEDKTTGATLSQLAKQSLMNMGFTPDQIEKKGGVDPNARAVSGKGVSGDPKTDIILDGKQISVKLPGQIQLASGEAQSSLEAFSKALDEYMTLPKNWVKTKTQEAIFSKIQEDIEKLMAGLKETIGARYYPSRPGTTKLDKELQKYLDAEQEAPGYLKMIRARAKYDWNRNKYPSSGITKEFKRGESRPQVAYPSEDEYVREFTKLAMKYVSAEGKRGGLPWEKINEQILKDLKPILQGLPDAPGDNDDYYSILVDELLTGRRTMDGENVAEYLLSPYGFDAMLTLEDTRKIAQKYKDVMKRDIRGKGRDFLGKAVTVRIDIDQNKYEKSVRNQLAKKLRQTEINEQADDQSDAATEVAAAVAEDLASEIFISTLR